MLNALVTPESFHELSDLVCQFDLVALTSELEEESSIVLLSKYGSHRGIFNK